MSSPVTWVAQAVVRDWRSILGRWLSSGVIVASIALVGLSVGVPAASAHGGPASEEGYILVQQALGELAHSTSRTGVDLAMEKIDAALVVKDQEGVAVAEVKKAKQALEAGQIEQTRTLLQGSIKEALGALEPATGEQTGTTVVLPELPGRNGLGRGDWAMLAASLVLLLTGIGLAFRFRPHDTVGELRQRLGASTIAAGNSTHVETEL